MTVLAEGAFCDLDDRVVVAPTYGRIRIAPPEFVTAEGEVVAAGSVLADVDTGTGSVPVSSPVDAWLLAVLVTDGEHVTPGDPVFHLRAL